MAKYSSEIIEEVRQANDIVEVIAQYITLKRSGRNYFGICPFHNEKSPSLSVSPDRQIFHCFGCGAGGDVFSFVSKINGMNFYETIQTLAERANITLPKLNNNLDAEKEEFKSKVYKVNEFAAEYYHKKLYEPSSKIAQEYVKKRKLSQETLESFKIGFSGNFDELYKELTKAGFKDPEILESGLVNKNEKGRYIDRYRKRLMFPICDARGKIIAFGGRVLDDSKPKYINSPENVVYSKGRHLYGLNVAKKHDIRKRLLIVEGYMDVISLHQRGIPNVVAALGTALTEPQGYLLRNNTEEIILSFDSDAAGQTAINRSISILQKMGCDLRVLQMEGAKDPDEYVLKYGSARFNHLMDKAISVIEFKVKNLKTKLDINNTNDRIKFLKEIAKLISKIDSSIEREVYIDKIARTYQISKEAVYAEVNKLTYTKTNDQKKLNANKTIKTTRKLQQKSTTSKAIENREDTIVSLLLTGDQTIYEIIKQNIKVEDYQSEINKQIATKLYEEYEKGNSNINSILNQMSEEEQSHATKILIDDYEIKDKEKAIDDILGAYKREKMNQRKIDLVGLIETEEDENTKAAYEQELKDIIFELAKIKSSK